MESYRNLGGDSGVSGYEAGSDYIIVQFSNGASYLYNGKVTGVQNIARMKQLASRGSGLNSFINTHVKKSYAAKLT